MMSENSIYPAQPFTFIIVGPKEDIFKKRKGGFWWDLRSTFRNVYTAYYNKAFLLVPLSAKQSQQNINILTLYLLLDCQKNCTLFSPAQMYT